MGPEIPMFFEYRTATSVNEMNQLSRDGGWMYAATLDVRHYNGTPSFTFLMQRWSDRPE